MTEETVLKSEVKNKILKEAIKIETEEADNDTWGGPDPRGPDAKWINLDFARRLRKLANEFS